MIARTRLNVTMLHVRCLSCKWDRRFTARYGLRL